MKNKVFEVKILFKNKYIFLKLTHLKNLETIKKKKKKKANKHST